MLRNEAEVAVNDLLEALWQAADVYADDAAVAGEEANGRLLDELARRRAWFADRLRALVPLLGDLPREPDADRETLQRLGHRLKAVVAPDGPRVVMEELNAGEARLTELVELALAQSLPEEVRALLLELREDLVRTRSRLA